MKAIAATILLLAFIGLTYTLVRFMAWWVPIFVYGGSLLLTACVMVLCGCEKEDFIDLWK